MITSALPLLFVIIAVVVLGATRNLFASSPFVIVAQTVAVGLSVWARRSFRPGTFRVTAVPGAESIIRSGPYRFVRHPMYSAALLFIWAAVLSHWSVVTAAIGIAVTVVIVARVIAEERLLCDWYPEYRNYARSTKALVPPHLGMRQYWRDFDSLEQWARSDPHREWWQQFVRDSGGTGFWHEAYFMGGGMEAVYDDVVRATGFLRFAPSRPARGAMFSARGRASKSGDAAIAAPVGENDLYAGGADKGSAV